MNDVEDLRQRNNEFSTNYHAQSGTSFTVIKNNVISVVNIDRTNNAAVAAAAEVAVADWKATVPIVRRTTRSAEQVPLNTGDECDEPDDEGGSSCLLHATTLTLPT